MGVHWKDWCWNWNSNTLFTSWEELTHWKRPWYWEGLGAGGEGDDRRWDGWMASPTWWTWRPGMLQFMGSQRVGHDWETETNWTDLKITWEQETIGKLNISLHWALSGWRIWKRPMVTMSSVIKVEDLCTVVDNLCLGIFWSRRVKKKNKKKLSSPYVNTNLETEKVSCVWEKLWRRSESSLWNIICKGKEEDSVL